MSNSNKDITDDITDGINAVAVGTFGLIAAGIAGLMLHNQSQVRLPETIEPPSSGQQSNANSVDNVSIETVIIVYGVLSIVLVAFVGVVTLPNNWTLLPIVGGVVAIVLTIIVAMKIGAAFPPTRSNTSETDEAVPPIKRYAITLPKDTKWQSEQAQRFVEQVMSVIPHCVLQIRAEYQSLIWELMDWRANSRFDEVQNSVHTYYPDAEVTEISREGASSEQWYYPFYRYTLHFHQVQDFVWPLKTVFDLKIYDPLVSLTKALATLLEGERVTYTLATSIPAEYAYKEGEKLIMASRLHPLEFMTPEGRDYALGKIILGRTREQKYRETDQKQARSKLSGLLYQAFLMVQVDTYNEDRLSQLCGVDAQIWEFENSPYNALGWCEDPFPESVKLIEDSAAEKRTSSLNLLRSWVFGQNPTWKRSRLILSTQEIAALWHLPHEGFTAPTITWLSGKRVPVSPQMMQVTTGVSLGTNVHAGKTTPIRLQDSDRQGHVYIIGKTGSGKSTLLHNIIHQDIAAGKGVGVIDPHGKLVNDILRSSIPESRENDVVLLEVANTSYPPPLNPFAIPKGIPREVALSQILGVLKKIYAEDWSATRMESAIYSALAALLYDSEATPRDISRMFLDPVYRQQLLRKVDDPVALEYWYDEYDNLAPGVQKQTREPVLNRIRIFYRNAAVRNMVCHPHQIDFRSVVEGKKIFLANLKSEETRSEKENLGALLIAQLQLAALSHQISEGETSTNFYLVVDEVQQFITTSLPETFSEARKFGLSLTVANQYLGQLQGSTLDAILGNAGATIIYGCGPSDARALTSIVQPAFSANDLVNFDRFHAAAKIQVNSQSVPAFSLNSPEPIAIPPDGAERERHIRSLAINNYTPWTRQEVEDWQTARYSRADRNRPLGEVTDYD